MTTLTRSRIRTVDPYQLQTPAGWNTALRADRRDPTATSPRWCRGDVAIPIETAAGTLMGCSDTWVNTTAGVRLARNTLVLVDGAGNVDWLRPATGQLEAISCAPNWWWPMGGYAFSFDAWLFGSTWHPGGDMFGTCMATTVVRLSDIANTNPAAVPALGEPVDLDLPPYTWGPPANIGGGAVVMAGYDPQTWQHHLAVGDAADPTSDWDVSAIAVYGGSPLGPLRLMPWHGGLLATAKLLTSAPGLDYLETPEVAAWWGAEAIPDALDRTSDLHHDTTRPGWYSYAAGACWLPGAGLCTQWSRNGPATRYGPGDLDGYGPVFDYAVAPPTSLIS